jgi:hypothetical protein
MAELSHGGIARLEMRSSARYLPRAFSRDTCSAGRAGTFERMISRAFSMLSMNPPYMFFKKMYQICRPYPSQDSILV